MCCSDENKHPNDVLVSGFSGSILSFIAERGDNNQLQYVEMIDEVKNLEAAKKRGERRMRKQARNQQQPLRSKFDFSSGTSITSSYKSSYSGRSFTSSASKEKQKKANAPPKSLPPQQRSTTRVRQPGEWASVRVFISSTFLDMHGERDVLTQYVFPELRKRCEKIRIHVNEVDLRWGVTDEMTKQKNVIEVRVRSCVCARVCWSSTLTASCLHRCVSMKWTDADRSSSACWANATDASRTATMCPTSRASIG